MPRRDTLWPSTTRRSPTTSGQGAGLWRWGSGSRAALRCREAALRWVYTALLACLSVLRSYGDVTYADVLLNPSRYVGRQFVLRGTFYYKNTERNSFQLKQGNDEVEVFCEQLSSAKQSLVLSQKNFSGVPVTVMGTVQRFRDARNSYYITASDVVLTGTASAQATPRQSGLVLYTDILVAPERYLGRIVTMKGAFHYRNTERASFDLKQGDDTVEVFYEQLPELKRASILRERNFSGSSATVIGTVHRFRDAGNSYYIMATDVSVQPARPVVEAPGPSVRREGRTGALAASPVPAQPKPKHAFPTTPVVRERSGASRGADLEGRKDVYEITKVTVLSIVCLVVLLTTIWVAFDARANKITASKGPYSLHNGALVWVLACALLWIAAFPYYLVRRSTVMREREKGSPAPGPPPTVPVPRPAPGKVDEGAESTGHSVGKLESSWKPGVRCYYAEHGKVVGPMEEAYLHVLVKGGQLDARKALVWQEGMDGWWFYDEAFMRREGKPARRPLPANAPPLPAPRPLATAQDLPQQALASASSGRASEQPSFVKGSCQLCGGHLEFNSLNIGQTITCPHCRKETRLEQNLDLVGNHLRPRAKSLPVGIPLRPRKTTSAAAAPASPNEN